MASLAAKAERNQRARARLAAALAALAERLDIPVPDEPRRMHDADLQPIVEVERFADVLESVLAALPAAAKPAPKPEPADVTTTTTPAPARRGRS